MLEEALAELKTAGVCLGDRARMTQAASAVKSPTEAELVRDLVIVRMRRTPATARGWVA